MRRISLIIPAKKEPNALPIVLEEIKKNNYDFNIIVILDKNDIETFNSIKNLDCQIIWQSRKGYGNAIVEGINHCQTKYLCIFYADGSTDPKFILPMLKKLEENKYDFIFGSRYEKNAYSYDDNIITKIGNFFFYFSWKFFYEIKINRYLIYIYSRQNRGN